MTSSLQKPQDPLHSMYMFLVCVQPSIHEDVISYNKYPSFILYPTLPTQKGKAGDSKF